MPCACQAFREDGKVKHKRLLYFGSVDLETAERLKIVFSKDFDCLKQAVPSISEIFYSFLNFTSTFHRHSPSI